MASSAILTFCGMNVPENHYVAPRTLRRKSQADEPPGRAATIACPGS